ncbi:hypothetical protein [Rosistilla oblonga]|uniref:hypothetical protein n=1 Tax=Rosistilla oblonga TaxID=2527990 RepID=UPI003A97F086
MSCKCVPLDNNPIGTPDSRSSRSNRREGDADQPDSFDSIGMSSGVPGSSFSTSNNHGEASGSSSVGSTPEVKA